MKKKIIVSTIGTGLLLAVLIACSEEFLETVPTGSANNVILASEKGVQMLLIGAYAGIDGTPTSAGSSLPGSTSNWVFGGFASDDAYKGQGQTGEAASTVIETYTADANTPYLEGRWSVDYNVVQRANDVLRIMANTKGISDANRKSYEAQARFIRAFMHFEAKRVFNNIPYITEKDNAAEVPNTVSAWPGIEADLKYAMENLPASWGSEVGRATKYAAEAVLAKVYIFQNKWNEAKPLLDDIIASGKYELMPAFEDNFRIAKRNNKESVFEIQYSIYDGASGQANAGYGQYAVNGMIGVDGISSCCGGYQPSQNLVNAFQVDPVTGLPLLDIETPANLKNDMGITSTTFWVQDTVTPVDPRLDYTVGRRGIPFLDMGIMRGYSWIREQAYGGPYINKKYQFLKSEVGTYSNTIGWATGLNVGNYRAVRYAHVLLLRAEVAAETGDLAYATQLVNMIRDRADNNVIMGRCRTFVLPGQGGLKVDYTKPAANYLIKPYPATFPNLDYARRAIRMEQRLELAMEGHRFFDLVRWGIAAKTINAFIQQDIPFRNYLGGSSPAVFVEGKNEFWPIPQTQLDLQPGVLVQNPGY